MWKIIILIFLFSSISLANIDSYREYDFKLDSLFKERKNFEISSIQELKLRKEIGERIKYINSIKEYLIQHIEDAKRFGWPLRLPRDYTEQEWGDWWKNEKVIWNEKGIPSKRSITERIESKIKYIDHAPFYDSLIGTSWWNAGFNVVEHWQFAKDSILVTAFHYFHGPTPSGKARNSRNCWTRIFSTNEQFTDTVYKRRYCEDGWPNQFYPEKAEYDKKTKLWIKDIHVSSGDGVVYNKYDVYRIDRYHCRRLNVRRFEDNVGRNWDVLNFYQKQYREDDETPTYGFDIQMNYVITKLTKDTLFLRHTHIEYWIERNFKMIDTHSDGLFTKECPVPLNMWMWKIE